MKLNGLKAMSRAYNSLLVLDGEKVRVYMHPDDLELYEQWQDENTPYFHMRGHFKGSKIEERISCTRGWVTFEQGDRVMSVSFEFVERES